MGIEPTSETWEARSGRTEWLAPFTATFPMRLNPKQGECPLRARHVKVVHSQNLKVTQSVSHAQLVVGLKFISVADVTDTLKVFPAVRIPCPQTPNKSCWDDVIHVPPRACLPKI